MLAGGEPLGFARASTLCAGAQRDIIDYIVYFFQKRDLLGEGMKKNAIKFKEFVLKLMPINFAGPKDRPFLRT